MDRRFGLAATGQEGQSETEQPDHSASLGDSITASTQIRFSVHTGAFQELRLYLRLPSCAILGSETAFFSRASYCVFLV
jgi:hypothetical protein